MLWTGFISDFYRFDLFSWLLFKHERIPLVAANELTIHIELIDQSEINSLFLSWLSFSIRTLLAMILLWKPIGNGRILTNTVLVFSLVIWQTCEGAISKQNTSSGQGKQQLIVLVLRLSQKSSATLWYNIFEKLFYCGLSTQVGSQGAEFSLLNNQS